MGQLVGLAEVAEYLGLVSRGKRPGNRMLRQTDPRSRVTSFIPNALNRLTAIGDAAGGATRFGYDPNGNLLSLTDALGHATAYHPNDMDQIDLRTDPLGFSETFHYDKTGNLDAYTDRKAQQTTFTYDGLNRRRVTSYLTDASSTTLNWDGGDRLLQVLDSVGGTITNTWTPRDRLLTQQTALGTITYTEYDTLDRLKKMTPPGQAQILYGYTPISQLASVQQGTQLASLAYDDAARRMTLTLPNTVPTTYGYDNANRLTSLLYGTGGNLGTLVYAYDPASNRTAVSGTFARTLLPAAVATSSYDAANRQLTFGGQTMTYDNNGNLGTITVQTGGGPQVTQFTWDQRNRLGTLAGPSLTASFIYDGLGRRTSRTINANPLSYLYDGVDILQEGVGAAGVNYLRGLGVDEPFGRGTSEFYLSDALGSTVALTNANGNLRTTYSYEPFGRTQASGPASTNPYQFTGRENDGTGLYYYRARYYHPGLQRFISEDPLGFRAGDSNLYAYARNTPLSTADPLGLCAPPGGGVGYCIDAYIPHPGVPLPQYGPFSGDNRGPNANGGTYRTRQLILSNGTSSSDAGKSTIIGTEFGIRGTARCTATALPLPLGGRKIVAECAGYNGFDIPDLGPLPPLYYVIVIQENKEGAGRVVGAWGTAYPSLEVWQYSRSGSPRQLLDYQTPGTIGDLFNGGVPLPVRR